METIQYSLEDFEKAKALLEDEMILILCQHEFKGSPDSGAIIKLLRARNEDLDFENKLAHIICGNNQNFPYHNLSTLIKLFNSIMLPQYKYECIINPNYPPFGFTRDYEIDLVINTLEQLNIKDICKIISEVFKDKYFEPFAKEKGIDKIKLQEVATKEFTQFLDNCLSVNKTLDLGLITGTNLISEMLFETSSVTDDVRLQELIMEAKKRFLDGDEKVALDTIWDAFERMKTYYSKEDKKNKKDSVEKIIEACKFDANILHDEFKTLTTIGNTYQIRHYEKNTPQIQDTSTCVYLFYRMLSLINFCIIKINNCETKIKKIVS